MDEINALKDILQSRISNQVFYNENLIQIRNPEIRQVFTELRDDEMRAIVKLQQRIHRLDASPSIVSKIFPTRSRY